MQNIQPRVSVVVPVYNAGTQILQLLDRLRYQSYPQELTEVVIVDDGSTDDTKNIINFHYPEFTVISVNNSGSYFARNVGVANTQGDILAFTDADCIPHNDWLRNGVEALIREGADIVAGAVCMRVSNKRSAIQMYDKLFGINQEFYAAHEGFGATANLFATRLIVQRVGAFDSSVRSGGDKKFCNKILASGGKLFYSDASSVDHPVRKTLKENLKKVIRVYTGLVQFSPPWALIGIRRLSRLPPPYFNYDEFLGMGSSMFRARLKLIYYFIHCVAIFAFNWASLKRSISRLWPTCKVVDDGR